MARLMKLICSEMGTVPYSWQMAEYGSRILGT